MTLVNASHKPSGAFADFRAEVAKDHHHHRGGKRLRHRGAVVFVVFGGRWKGPHGLTNKGSILTGQPNPLEIIPKNSAPRNFG